MQQYNVINVITKIMKFVILTLLELVNIKTAIYLRPGDINCTWSKLYMQICNISLIAMVLSVSVCVSVYVCVCVSVCYNRSHRSHLSENQKCKK